MPVDIDSSSDKEMMDYFESSSFFRKLISKVSDRHGLTGFLLARDPERPAGGLTTCDFLDANYTLR
jgi:hypothetical protein